MTAGQSAAWPTALDDFDAHLRAQGRSYNTRKSHAAYLRRFAAAHSWLAPWDVPPDHVGRWVAGLHSAEYSRSAAMALRLFYAWAVRAGLAATSPAQVAIPARRPGAQTTGASIVAAFPVAWIEPVTGWTAYLRASGGSERTGKLYRSHLAALGRVEADPWAVDPTRLVAWLAGRDLQPETRRSIRATLRSFYRWALAAGLVAVDPTALLPSVRVPAAVPRPAPDDVLTAALSGSDDKTRLMVCLSAFAGLRNAEVAAVRPQDVTEGRLYVTGKGGRQRVIPVHPVLAQELCDELARRRAGGCGTGFRYASTVTVDGWLFPSPTGGHVAPDAVHRAVTRVLLPGWTPHKLRHRFATRAYAGTKDLLAVQRLLGHSRPETTQRYTAVPDDALSAAVLAV